MSQVTLFSGYSQKENRTTNYCLLVLKMLYEENPKFLAEFLSSVIDDVNLGENIGVKFRQQQKKATNNSASILDGVIFQPQITIYIETKNFNWFYDAQLENHLENLNAERSGIKILIALSNFEDDAGVSFKSIEALCREKYKETIKFKQVTFEKFIQALPVSRLPKNLTDAVADFQNYLNEESLLPSWKKWLDVVNCAGNPEEILSGRVYMCPAAGGAYNHDRCKYFGMYRNKHVEKVAVIEAVADLENEQSGSVKWHNIPGKNEDFIASAHAKFKQYRSGEYPIRVFLLGELYDTDFQKDSYGGMQTSKQYFNIESLEVAEAAALALALRGRKWSEFRRQQAEE